ncbi:MAG: hypothetical protein LBD29_02400 [Treponema sp.]|jgi:O-glycosyl hydrolase|nr:hypothetical protein [Treponema sp.]
MLHRIRTLLAGVLIGLVVPLALYPRPAVEIEAPGKKSPPGSGSQPLEGIEKITAVNGAFAVYKFTLPQGETFGSYTKITAQFLVDRENYKLIARARLLGNYTQEDFSETPTHRLIDYSSGETDKNGPYIASNLYGSDTPFDIVSSEAGPNAWFALEFPLTGKRHNAYKEEHFPDPGAAGDFYFCLGLSKAGVDGKITYYVKEVTLSNDDGSKTVVSKGSGFDKPAFAAYSDGVSSLARETPPSVGDGDKQEQQPGPVTIRVNTSTAYQKVIGFGGMSNAWTSPVLTEDDIDTMYGPDGLGYTILRIMIYPDPAKWDDYVGIAKKAQSYGATILASPWTPPAELKSNNSTTGGYLLPENYGNYADHLKSFVRRMNDQGVRIDVISLQNEPDIQVGYDSCDWTPEQMLQFVKEYGPDLKEMVELIPGESFQYKRNFTDPLLQDSEALKGFDIIGGHIYGGGLSRYGLAHEKGKEVWMTEHLLNTSSNFTYDSTWPAALMVAEEIHACMTADFNAYIWWYLKRFYSMIGDGEYNTLGGQILNRGYVLSHYAKYATGTTRIEAVPEGNTQVFVSAYQSAEAVNLVIINMGNSVSEGTILLPETVRSYSSVESKSDAVMQPKTISINPEGTAAAVTLEPKSIVSISFSK